MLSTSREIKIDDVFALATPLAAEQIKSPQMWQRFAEIAVQKEYEVDPREYFQSFANLSWAMAKVNYSGLQFWAFIERLYLTEMEKTKLRETPPEMSSAIFATICFALKDCQPHDFSDEFWRDLNKALREFLRNQSQAAPGEK